MFMAVDGRLCLPEKKERGVLGRKHCLSRIAPIKGRLVRIAWPGTACVRSGAYPSDALLGVSMKLFIVGLEGVNGAGEREASTSRSG